MSYKLPLKVCNTKGARVYASITKVGDRVNLRLPYIEAVRIDSPKFSKDGVVFFNYDRKDHRTIVDQLTKYLEDLFLKELSDEDNNTSDNGRSNTRRDKKKSKSRTTPKSEGKKIDSVCDSGRGSEQAESDRSGSKDSELVKGSSSVDKE